MPDLQLVGCPAQASYQRKCPFLCKILIHLLKAQGSLFK